MKNIAVIPARGGSKRLPGKNIMLLGGIPLVAHSILEARKCKAIDAVYVSTDDDKIASVSKIYEAEVICRPASISGDHEPTVSALKHVLEQLGNPLCNVFLLQPTNPLRPGNLLSDAFESFQNSNADSLMTVSRNKHKLGKLIDNRYVPFNYEMGQRSQDIEPLFYENGLLYIIKSECIQNNIILAENNFAFETNHPFSEVDIDTRKDFDFAEYLLKKYETFK